MFIYFSKLPYFFNLPLWVSTGPNNGNRKPTTAPRSYRVSPGARLKMLFPVKREAEPATSAVTDQRWLVTARKQEARITNFGAPETLRSAYRTRDLSLPYSRQYIDTPEANNGRSLV
jgi:hypothetical protein